MKVLFVCLGNICRSPTADAVLKKLVAENRLLNIDVDSAGTAGYHIGKSPDPRAIKAGREKGYDLSGLSARQFTESDFNDFDLILAMDKQNLKDIQVMQPQQCRARVSLAAEFSELNFDEVPDPYYGGDDGFKEVIELCESISRGVIDYCLQDNSL